MSACHHQTESHLNEVRFLFLLFHVHFHVVLLARLVTWYSWRFPSTTSSVNDQHCSSKLAPKRRPLSDIDFRLAQSPHFTLACRAAHTVPQLASAPAVYEILGLFASFVKSILPTTENWPRKRYKYRMKNDKSTETNHINNKCNDMIINTRKMHIT